MPRQAVAPPEAKGSGTGRALPRIRFHRPRRSARGFTLLEALVAFALASLALAALFDGTLSGLRAVDDASRTEDAISRARSHLEAAAAALGSEGDLVQEGDDAGGDHWSTTIHPIGHAASRRERRVGIDPTITNGLTLYRIDVAVTYDGGARTVRLATERLVVGKPHAA